MIDWQRADPLSLEAMQELGDDLQAAELVCIGEETAEQARALGWSSFLTFPTEDDFATQIIPSGQGDAVRAR